MHPSPAPAPAKLAKYARYGLGDTGHVTTACNRAKEEAVGPRLPWHSRVVESNLLAVLNLSSSYLRHVRNMTTRAKAIDSLETANPCGMIVTSTYRHLCARLRVRDNTLQSTANIISRIHWLGIQEVLGPWYSL